MPSAVLLKLLVILLTVALGYVAGRLRWLGPGDPARVLGYAAFYVFVPALLLRTTSQLDLAAMPWGTLAAFFVPVLAQLTLLYLWHRRQPGRPGADPSTRAITATFGNTVQLGIPMAAAIFGEAGLRIHVAIVSLHALVLLTVLTALVELDLARERAASNQEPAHRGTMLWDTARKTIIHPVVLPILVGLAWNVSALPMPQVLDELLVQLSGAVVPMCLLLIGVSLAQYGLRRSWRSAIGFSVFKLLVLPAMVLLVGRVGFGLQGVPLAVVVMAAALPTGNNALIFAQRYGALEGEATATIAVSTFGFALTAPAWLALLAWL